ncbi:hypothetical protein NMG60_11002198 [Bertholletia excelsa]
MIAITMAISVTLIHKHQEGRPPLNIVQIPETPPPVTVLPLHAEKPLPSRRVSRFLAQHEKHKKKNARAARQCHKDHKICHLHDDVEGHNSTCCSNKCVNLATDWDHCGSCKRRCEFTEACCRGECVELAYDKRHCGRCNHRCSEGLYCIYGMCDYA